MAKQMNEKSAEIGVKPHEKHDEAQRGRGNIEQGTLRRSAKAHSSSTRTANEKYKTFEI